MIKLIDFSKKYNGEKDFAVKNIFLEADKGEDDDGKQAEAHEDGQQRAVR